MSPVQSLEPRRLMAVELSFGGGSAWATSFRPGDFHSVPTVVVNGGSTAATAPFSVGYRLVPVPAGAAVTDPDFDDPGAVPWATRQVDEDVPAGGTVDLRQELLGIPVPPGRYALVRKVDGTDVYAEGNEGDNVDSLGVSRFVGSNAIAIVEGTAGADRISLTARIEHLGEVDDRLFELTINGVTERLRGFNGVAGFDVRAGDGDDVVVVDSLEAWPDGLIPLPIRMDGGGGDDRVAGSFDDETLAGGPGKDNLDGNGGDDRLYGNGGSDKLSGGAGADRLYGYDGDDGLAGGAGADRLYGHGGDDFLNGGSSGDRLTGGAGVDTLMGEGGADRFLAADGRRDALFGGSGSDAAAGDASDLLASVERLIGGVGGDNKL